MLRTLIPSVVALSVATTALRAQDADEAGTERKNPATARTIGIIPGAGHMYAGEALRGLSYYITTTSLFAGAAISGLGCLGHSSDDDCEAAGNLLLVAGVAVWGWSIYDAGRAAERTNAKRRLGMSLIVAPASSWRGGAGSARALRVGLSFPTR